MISKQEELGQTFFLKSTTGSLDSPSLAEVSLISIEVKE
jgi:hypothetical protein